jgi:long-chain acyl-CoA synthetase
MPELKTLYSALVQSASNEPERTALTSPKGKVSYHNLLMDTDRAVDMFWSLGIRADDKVILALRNSTEFIINHFALNKIGAIAVPVNFLITKPQELEFIISHSNAKGILTQKEFSAPYAKLKKKLQNLEFIISTDSEEDEVLNFKKILKKAPYHPEAHNQKTFGTDICSILYTSGTTGHPKGVILTHNNILSNAASCTAALNLTRDDVFLCILPMFHTFAFTATTVLPIMLGAKIVLSSHITPATPWLNLMGREGVTVMAGVPQLFSVLSKEARGLKRFYLQYWAFRKARFCVSGAAPLPENVLNHFEKKLKIPLLEGYGLTETSPVVSVNRVENKKAGSVGKPLNKVDIKIVDENYKELKIGSEGEICVKGICVTKGYFKDSTKDGFTADGWLKTGDIGVLDKEGYLYIRDRKKDMIINKGLKVFPVQVESVFLTHPQIEECAVVGVPHKNGEELIKCFCVLKENSAVTKAELMQFARKNLDPYKRPREIEILKSLPKNALNKVLKRHLRVCGQ